MEMFNMNNREYTYNALKGTSTAPNPSVWMNGGYWRKLNAKPDIWYIRNDGTLFFKTPERSTTNRYCLIKFDNDDDIYDRGHFRLDDEEQFDYDCCIYNLTWGNIQHRQPKFIDRYIDTNLDPSFNKKGVCA